MSRAYLNNSIRGILSALLGVSLVLAGCKKENEATPDTTPEAMTQSIPDPSPLVDGSTALNRSLRILYVGHPGSSREQGFVTFLSEHFDTVGRGDLTAFRESDTDGFDVTIMDYDGDGFRSPRPRMSASFTRPVLTLGVPGAFICRNLDTKLGYL